MRSGKKRQPTATSKEHFRTKPDSQGSSGKWFSHWEWLVVLAAVVCDWNSWGHQFVMDDLTRILGNAILKAPGQVLNIFFSPYNTVFGSPSDLYRPLTTLSFAINHWISGDSPDSFHAVNRAIHVLTCLGIFWALRRLFAHTSPHVPVLTALLFAVHPLQTEAITYINGRSDALAMMFFVFAWLFYIRTRIASPPNQGDYWLSMVFYFLALLTKESAITWLGVAVLTELVFFSQNHVEEFVGAVRARLWKLYSGYLGVTLAYLAVRFSVLKNVARVYVGQLDNPLAHVSTPARVFTALELLFKSIGLTIWPVQLSADYSYNQISLISHWNSLAGVFIALATLALILLLIWSFRYSAETFFSLGFFLITYFIVSNLVIPIGTIFAERLLYMPALGILIIVGICLDRLERRLQTPDQKRIFLCGVVVILLLLALRTVVRNRDWSNGFTLYVKTVQTSPHSAKAHNDLGAQYFDRKEFDLARREYHIAESIKPDYADLLNNIGSLKSVEAKNEEAAAYFRRAVALSPANPGYGNNLGLALRMQGNLAGAIREYDRVLARYPDNARAHFNKANALYAQGKLSEAISEYRRTLEIDPDFGLARSNLEAVLGQLNPSNPQRNQISK
jgi:Tfp pilus assembly protein PilF